MLKFGQIKKSSSVLVKLNLPEYHFKTREIAGKGQIFDKWRKKFVSLTPEEWVRQNFLMYLVEEKKYPSSLLAVEAGLKLYTKSKRTDILIFGRGGEPLAIVECKAPEVKINEQVFDQIVRYNMAFQVNYLMVTNGLQHFCCRLNYEDNSYSFLKEIPKYNFILT
jgi:hypothetical protein